MVRVRTQMKEEAKKKVENVLKHNHDIMVYSVPEMKRICLDVMTHRLNINK